MNLARLLVVVVGGLGLGASGCAADSAPSPPTRPEPDASCEPGHISYVACSCGDGVFGKVARDECTDETVGSCDCGEVVACETEGFPCAASQRCFAEAECDACACNPPIITEPKQLSGHVVDIAADGMGGVLLLTGQAPWLARITPAGTLTWLGGNTDLAWGTRVWHAADGSIAVLGTVGNDDAAAVRVERFDGSGALLSTTSWSPEPGTGCNLLDVAVRPDGRLAVLAAHDEWLALGILNNAKGAIESVSVVDFATDPLQTGATWGRRLTDFAIGPEGDYFMVGGIYRHGRYDGSWRLRLAPDGQPAAEHIDTAFDLFPSNPLLAGGEAGVFQAWTWRFDDYNPFDAYYARLTPELGESWRQRTEGEDRKDSRVTALSALPDGVLVGGTELDKPVLRRFAADGASMVVPITLELAPERIVPVADYQVAILEPPPMYQNVAYYRLTWLTLEGLRP